MTVVNKSKQGKTSRRKGRDYQARLAKRFRDNGTFTNASSTHSAQSRRQGYKPPDIEGTPYWIECKHRKTINVLDSIKQAEDEALNAKDERPALAILKWHGDRGEPIVAMRLKDFERLVQQKEKQ